MLTSFSIKGITVFECSRFQLCHKFIFNQRLAEHQRNLSLPDTCLGHVANDLTTHSDLNYTIFGKFCGSDVCLINLSELTILRKMFENFSGVSGDFSLLFLNI